MDLKQEIRNMLFKTEMARKRRLHPEWGKMGLIAGQPRVLSELYYNENITQKELADLSGLDPATLSRILDRLEKMGHIIRNGNPDSRRSFLIALTAQGKVVAESVWKEFHELEMLMMTGFSEEEMQTLYSWIVRIYENMGGDAR